MISVIEFFQLQDQELFHLQRKTLMLEAYQSSQIKYPLFWYYVSSSQTPITFEDSLSPFPNYPFCALGMINAEGKWGKQKGIAFVVEDEYLLTCASNCYSHQHGEFPNITFVINSNRKHGYETHKIAKVFLPQQYKTLPQTKRQMFNYALLYIEGKPNLKDNYGSIEMNFSNKQQELLSCFHFIIKNQYELQLVAKINMEDQQSYSIPCGSPILFYNQYGNISATGLFLQRARNGSKELFLRFSQTMKPHFAESLETKLLSILK